MWYDSDNEDESLPSLLKPIDGDDFTITEGTLILVDPQKRLTSSEVSGYSVSISIFDALGNRVLNLNSLTEDNGSIKAGAVVMSGRVQFAIVWNATNSKNRRVGGGAYLAIVSAKNSDGDEIVKKHAIKIPVEK